MSAIKGGKLASASAAAASRSSTPTSRAASSPTSPRGRRFPEATRCILIADNDTLTATAAGGRARARTASQPFCATRSRPTSEPAAKQLAKAKFDDVLIAGGEVTVTVRGDGKGGRCSDLALRYLLRAAGRRIRAALLRQQRRHGRQQRRGRDRSSTDSARFDRHAIETELGKSNSFPIAAEIGRAIMIPPAGNNLRDLYLLARG